MLLEINSRSFLLVPIRLFLRTELSNRTKWTFSHTFVAKSVIFTLIQSAMPPLVSSVCIPNYFFFFQFQRHYQFPEIFIMTTCATPSTPLLPDVVNSILLSFQHYITSFPFQNPFFFLYKVSSSLLSAVACRPQIKV